MIMLRIPSIKKFSGDNEVSLIQWLLQFEAQLGALGINPEQNRQMLSCCLEGIAFSYAAQQIGTNNLALRCFKERISRTIYWGRLQKEVRNKIMKSKIHKRYEH